MGQLIIAPNKNPNPVAADVKIKTFSLAGDSFSIDVPKNLIEAKKRMKIDKYYKIYRNKFFNKNAT